MDIFLAIAAVVLSLVGIVGCIVPIIPGTILSFAALLCVYFTPYSTISGTALVVWAVISLAVMLADYLLPGYMARLFGGSRAGSIGATVGMIVGMIFFNVPGVIFGSFVGALVGELLHNPQAKAHALKVGFGSFLSFVVGTGIKLVASVGMLLVVWRDVAVALKGWVSTLWA